MNQTGDRKQLPKLIIAGTVLLMATTLAVSPSAQAQAQEHVSPSGAIRLAQADSVTFDIPPQPLRSALTAFAEQSGWQLFYSAQVAEGFQSQGFSGSSTPEAALKQLLAGTRLDFRITEPRTVTLVEAPIVPSPSATPPPTRTPEPVSSSPSETPLPAAKEKPLKVEEVMVTVTRSQRPLAAIPEAVTVITREQIEKQTVLSRSLVDVLGKMVPGFAVGGQSLSNTGQTLRGRNALVLIDGVPQSTMRNAARDLSTIDPSAIERIEVLRGATSIYGDGATGGIIHIITKRPGEGKPSFTTDVLANTAPTNPTAGIGGRVVQSLAGKKGIFDYSLSGSYERVGGCSMAEATAFPQICSALRADWPTYTRIIYSESSGLILDHNIFS